MPTRTLKNKDGLILHLNDRISVDGKPGTIKGFNREMIRVELDSFPGSNLTLDATWRVKKLDS